MRLGLKFKEPGTGEIGYPVLYKIEYMENSGSGNISDHLANERTYLAWVRTSVGIMAFGFVVVKFTLFLRQISIVLQKPVAASGRGYSAVVGVILVGFGALMGVLSFFRYRFIDKQLRNIYYKPSLLLSTLLVLSILGAGIFLVIYLIESIN